MDGARSQLPAAREEAIKWGHKMLPAAISLALGEGAKAEAYFGQLIQTCTTRSRPNGRQSDDTNRNICQVPCLVHRGPTLAPLPCFVFGSTGTQPQHP